MKQVVGIAVAFVLLLSSAGCGGGGDEDAAEDQSRNQSPVANAGPAQTVEAGSSVTLGGSGSDPDGSIVSYAWTQTGGTSVALLDATRSTATFTAPEVVTLETLMFRLTVTDDDGAAASDTVGVAVVGEIAVTLPDANLRTVIEDYLGKAFGTPIFAHEMATLEILEAPDAGIRDLEGLQFATNLITLNLGYISSSKESNSNEISDFSPLAELTNLKNLYLESCGISNLSWLSRLTKLEKLTLNRNQGISDISPLAGLTNLKDLELSEFYISDVSPLAGLTNLVSLDLGSTGISDISPLTGLTKLHTLNLFYNYISDISPLAGLTQLRYLFLESNKISDLAPLVANAGLDRGDWVHLERNPLNAASVNTHIPALRGRGVEVSFDEALITVDGGPQVYKDNVFILPVAENLATTDHLPLRDYVIRFYEYFEDVFDFLMIVSNLRLGEDRERGYFGAHFSVMNDVEGIGRAIFSDDSWGSAGKLQSVLHFPSTWGGAFGGPTLHEMMHRWANFIVPSYAPHWGFTSANGNLGGFDIANLVHHGDGRYTAGDFTFAGYASNIEPFSPIELYLAGFIPPEEVPDLWVAEDGEALRDEDGNIVIADNGEPMFTASRVKTYTIEDIIAEYGPRVPDASQAQWDFHAAVILLIDENHPAINRVLRNLSGFASWFSYVGYGHFENYYNFYEATGGRGTITMDGLSQFRKQ